MAVPVIVDQDSDTEIVLQQLFADLWWTLQQIEVLQRRRQQEAQAAAVARVGTVVPVVSGRYRHQCTRCTSAVTQNVGEGSTSGQQSWTPPDHVNISVPLASGSIFQQNRLQESELAENALNLDSSKPLKVSISVEVVHKLEEQRNSQERFKNEEGVIAPQESLDQESEENRTANEGDGPPPSSRLSCTLWTAVICLVGWTLLRAR